MNPNVNVNVKPLSPSPFRRSQPGFTLVEVLVVLAIISLVMFAALPNMSGVIRGSKLTQGADQMKYDLSIAQQVAIKENVPVEVRFYRWSDPDYPDENKKVFTAYETFRLQPDFDKYSDPGAPRVFDSIFGLKRLPSGVAIPVSAKWATILTSGEVKEGTTQVRGLESTRKESDAEYRSYQIYPDGQTNFDKTGRDQWFFTLMDAATLSAASSVDEIEPDNYIVLQVEPFSGNIRWYQPN